jgi:hypothetical protein
MPRLSNNASSLAVPLDSRTDGKNKFGEDQWMMASRFVHSNGVR